MKAVQSAPEQTLLLSSLLQQVSFDDVQSLARLNVIRFERDLRNSSELVVTFRSQLTQQVFDEIQHAISWNEADNVSRGQFLLFVFTVFYFAGLIACNYSVG